jgi:putative multiple sugar transport system permease protein
MNPQVAAAVEVTPKPVKIRAASRSNFREYGLMIALIAIMIFFQIATNGTLFKPLNLTNLVLQNSYVVIMALGMLLVIVAWSH